MSYRNYHSKDYRTIARVFAEVRHILFPYGSSTHNKEDIRDNQVLSLVEDSMVRMFAEDNDKFKEDLFRDAARVKPLESPSRPSDEGDAKDT
tara:strand:+ start:314 stop:589 length:276 start_codon:yes stop_codon:yes gene_type:complete